MELHAAVAVCQCDHPFLVGIPSSPGPKAIVWFAICKAHGYLCNEARENILNEEKSLQLQ